MGKNVKLACSAHCVLLSCRNYWLFKLVIDLAVKKKKIECCIRFAAQQSDPAIHMHILFPSLSCYSSSQAIESSSLCCEVGPCLFHTY